ncbi:helix-turn-helix domain-containing protein [Haloarchaeobius sp. HRN-SO-5]|uniref:ArsR/SmtB family transcription factor n=1 Tax=Haloarchaeobius sp. HRN-SO-5 TaxID=3446118 RepID=UPI003EBAD634
MSRLLPFRSDETTPAPEQPPRVVDLEGDDADKVFGALSSDTARKIYTCLHDEPRTPSDVAEEIDSSIQNVRYHLEKLEDAGLIDVVDVWYSSRGNEMNVYAPQSGPLIVSGDEQRSTRLRSALSRFVGGVGVLAAASLFVQYGLPRLLGATSWTSSSADGAGGNDGGDVDVTGEIASNDTTTGGAEGTATTTDDVGLAVNEATQTEAAMDTQTAQPTGEPTAHATTASDAGVYTAETGNATAVDGGQQFADPTTTDGAATQTVDTAAQGADALVSSVPPGMLFFAGGLLVLTLVLGYWYWSGDDW